MQWGKKSRSLHFLGRSWSWSVPGWNCEEMENSCIQIGCFTANGCKVSQEIVTH